MNGPPFDSVAVSLDPPFPIIDSDRRRRIEVPDAPVFAAFRMARRTREHRRLTRRRAMEELVAGVEHGDTRKRDDGARAEDQNLRRLARLHDHSVCPSNATAVGCPLTTSFGSTPQTTPPSLAHIADRDRIRSCHRQSERTGRRSGDVDWEHAAEYGFARSVERVRRGLSRVVGRSGSAIARGSAQTRSLWTA